MARGAAMSFISKLDAERAAPRGMMLAITLPPANTKDQA
jgi:thiamine monophosphate kinase